MSKKKKSKSSSVKRKLAGFTKTKGKFRLVFKRGAKVSLGKSKYSSKVGLTKAANKFLKK